MEVVSKKVGEDERGAQGLVDRRSDNATSVDVEIDHQEKGSACWGTLFCMLTCKTTVLQVHGGIYSP